MIVVLLMLYSIQQNPAWQNHEHCKVATDYDNMAN